MIAHSAAMARRSSLLVSLALASLFLGLAAALSTTSIASEVEPLTGSAAAVTAGSSSAVVASVTSSADVAQAEPATAVVRNLEEQPSRASEANIEPADTEEYPGGDDVTEETSNNKGEGLAVETAPQLQGPGQAEAQALPDSSSTEAFEPVPVIRVVSACRQHNMRPICCRGSAELRLRLSLLCCYVTMLIV